MSRSTPPPDRDRLDPVVLHARREVLVILIAFVVCLIWSVSWCYLAGYSQPADGQVAKVLGMPSWVFWGVLVPWLAADVFALWFCFCFMVDDPLGESEETSEEDGNATGPGDDGGEDRHG